LNQGLADEWLVPATGPLGFGAHSVTLCCLVHSGWQHGVVFACVLVIFFGGGGRTRLACPQWQCRPRGWV